MLWQLGLMTWEIQSYSECLWQIFLQHEASCKQQQENVRLLEFMGKSMTFSADHYSFFEKYNLASYWILVGTEHLAIGHQVIMLADLHILNQVFSNPKIMKLGMDSTILSTTGNGI